MSVDMNRAGLLLHICDLANQWPKLKPLADAAMGELEGMSATVAKDLAEARARAKAAAEEEAAKLEAQRIEAEAKVKEESETTTDRRV